MIYTEKFKIPLKDIGKDNKIKINGATLWKYLLLIITSVQSQKL